MPCNPLSIIGEILGEPAAIMRNPVNAGDLCPFMNSGCMKRGQRTDGPYPVCSIWHGPADNRRLMAMCPRRFFEAEIKNDVVENCWLGQRPTNPQIAYEVIMSGFGRVDFVIADVDEKTNQIRNFVSVELQAVDCTGSVEPAFQAVCNSVNEMACRPSYGINWSNVRKRYIHQLINKGFYHHHWQSRIVSVIQTPLYNWLHNAMDFDELAPTATSANIVFLTYDFKPETVDGVTRYKLCKDKVVGTSHNSLMMASLYKTPPSKSEFIDRINGRLRKFDE